VVAYNTSVTGRRKQYVIIDNSLHQPGDSLTFLYGGEGTVIAQGNPEDGSAVFIELDLEPMQFVILR